MSRICDMSPAQSGGERPPPTESAHQPAANSEPQHVHCSHSTRCGPTGSQHEAPLFPAPGRPAVEHKWVLVHG